MPVFTERSLSVKVNVDDGCTLVLGGITQNQMSTRVDKWPLLGDLPFIGRFFRSHAEHTSKRNLLIFVTSRLVDTRGREITLSSGDETVAVTQPAPEKEAE
jgi:type II secretory pathway component GspD/PulD (secretin)